MGDSDVSLLELYCLERAVIRHADRTCPKCFEKNLPVLIERGPNIMFGQRYYACDNPNCQLYQEKEFVEPSPHKVTHVDVARVLKVASSEISTLRARLRDQGEAIGLLMGEIAKLKQQQLNAEQEPKRKKTEQ